MFVKLNRIIERAGSFSIEEVVVNTMHISFLNENMSLKSALMEGKMNLGITKNAEFTDISISSRGSMRTISVIGNISIIESKITHASSKRQLLKD